MRESAGYEVRTAGTGVKALVMLGHGSFDLFNFNLRMPDMNGAEW